MKLVLQSFGHEREYRRAVLLLRSYQAFVGDGAAVRLYTDAPAYFQSLLPGLKIDYVELTPERIKWMRGEIDFLHRMKIVLIEESLQQGDSILYADSDTFFLKDPAPLFSKVNEKVSFMHLKEYSFERLRKMELPAAKTFHAFLNLIESKTFTLADSSNLTITGNDESWNAGVMFLHRSHVKLIPHVYALTDQWFPTTQNHAAEQYAFSVVLKKFTTIQPCEEVIYHYWHRIAKAVVDDYLIREWEWLKSASATEIKSALAELQKLLQTHYLVRQDVAIQALNTRNWVTGFGTGIRAWLQKPTDYRFLRHLGYHFLRFINLRP